jgi:hypothetical protein
MHRGATNPSTCRVGCATSLACADRVQLGNTGASHGTKLYAMVAKDRDP